MAASRHRAAAVLAALAALAPGAAAGQAVAETGFVVKNNSSVRLYCRYRLEGLGWSAYFRFNPGAEFRRPAQSAATLRFFCDRPVRRLVYVLQPGERNSLLRAEDGWIVMRKIDVAEPTR